MLCCFIFWYNLEYHQRWLIYMYTYTHIHIYIFLNIEEHLPYRLQLFFTTAMIFSTVFLFEQRFSHWLFRKILCSCVRAFMFHLQPLGISQPNCAIFTHFCNSKTVGPWDVIWYYTLYMYIVISLTILCTDMIGEALCNVCHMTRHLCTRPLVVSYRFMSRGVAFALSRWQ